MQKFDHVPSIPEISWKPHPVLPVLEFADIRFPNGYGALILRTASSELCNMYFLSETLNGKLREEKMQDYKLILDTPEEKLLAAVKDIFNYETAEEIVKEENLWKPYQLAKKLLNDL